jgi:hypothetical protein
MHKQLLAGDEDALEDFEEGVADIVAALNAGTLEGNGIAEMAEIAGIYAELATTEEEEVTMFTYGTECETGQDYIPGGDHGITIDWDGIAEELGTTKDALKIYAMMPDGTFDETYGRGSTDGWRDANGNWETWQNLNSTKAPGFYVQIDGLTLAGVGCMNTSEPTQYTALFKVVNADAPEGKYVVLTITLNVKEKEIDTTVPTNVSELAVASTLKDVVTLKIGDNYTAGDGSSANVAAILAALGEESLDNVKIFAVQSDGSLDADYKLGTTDGWRNADGDWAGWGDATSQFYVKADFARATAQLYEVGCHPFHEGVHMTDVINYTAKYAFVVGNKTENKAVIYNVVVAVAPERTDLDVTGATVQYFYNVEAKGFILGANNWNTRASIGAKGYQMHFEVGNEGAYKLCASNKTGTNYAANDLDYDGNGDIWVDGAGRAGAGYWTYSVNADKTFTIASTYEPAKGLLSIVPSKNDTRLYMSEDAEAQSTWIAVSEEDFAAYQQVLKNYQDIKDEWDKTNYAVGDDLANLTPKAWEGQTGTFSGGRYERYSGGGSIAEGDVLTQTLEGLKNGTYEVTLEVSASFTSGRGFECPTGEGLVEVFVNELTQGINVLDRGWVSDGEFDVVKLTAVVSDGTLKYGIRNLAPAGNWYVANVLSVIYMSDTALVPGNPETAINEIEAKPAAAKAVYNMAGQQMNGLQKGLNIVGGKKVYVK